MIAALLCASIALGLVLVLPTPLCLIALVPWALGGWLFIESSRGRWN